MATRQFAGGQFFSLAPERFSDDKTDMKVLDTENNLASVASSFRKILHMNAQTSEEKFKILDARDKLYKMMRDKDSAAERGALDATCTDMCPEKERLLREYQGRGSIFEMTNFSKNSSFNHSLAVKEYARSSADQEEPLPHDLRPVHVLTMTMSHLLHNVVDYCELSDENLEEWYMFMWDRTRALRKELTQQGVCNLESVTLVEQCARFHIHCAERLIDQDSSIYDDKINTENLTKCLQSLKYMYKDLAKEDMKCPNEAEFICYSLLLNLNNSSVFTELSGMSSSLMNSKPVKFALDVMATWETKNYIRFFNLVKQTTYLNCCLLRRYFGEMRLYAIKTMIRSYCTKNYSPQILLSHFVETLNFEREEECSNFLSYCHFNFHEVDGKTVVNFDRVLFQNPSTTISSGRAFLFIEEKKRKPLSVIMAGGIMPPKLFENYVPHSSFTPNGDLNPDVMPQKELLEFFSSSGLSKIELTKTVPSLDTITEREEFVSTRDPRLQKEETPWVSFTPKFSFLDKNPPAVNIFGSAGVPSFGSIPINSNILGTNLSNANTGSFGNIFDSPTTASSSKNIFGYSSSPLFKGTVFDSESTPFTVPFSSADRQQETTKVDTESTASLIFTFANNSNQFVTNFQKKSESNSTHTKVSEDEERKKSLEEERLLRKKEEEDKRKKQEEEEAKMLLERQRLQEENEIKERERKERKKKEKEEKQKKEELARLENEERKRREEASRQERLRESNAKQLEELKRQEENKRKVEYKRKVDIKMSELKTKIQKWKTKIIFDKWRTKTWESIEGRKMKEYFKEMKVKYPPVCTEEMLNGNPYGLIIPNVLTLEKFKEWKKGCVREPSKKLLIVNDNLPLLKVNCLLGKSLEELAKSLGNKLDPFPWKLVISIPDGLECPESWKSIETFIEMHFVDNFNWQFGIQKGPLYCRGGSHKTFKFFISIRRLRGSKLYEGNEPNKLAVTGSNALLFALSGCGNEITRDRFKAVLTSRFALPKIPVVIMVLDAKPNENLKNLLELETLEKSYISKYFVIPVIDDEDQPVVQLKKCLSLAAINSAPPPSFRINRFSTFFSGSWIDSLWRRVEISLSNFKIVLKDPKILIEFYNSCIEELTDIFLDKNCSQHTVLAEEFSECEVKPPIRTPVYENRLKCLLGRFKLPHWPAEIPKSCHQLNYRIHQYCKKITGRDKAKIKNFKWVLYRIIRQSLSWKGLDIYCDEDISEILVNFPWIRVFQEITKVITRQLCEEVKSGKEVTVIYDLERIENFNFESSFIGKFLGEVDRRPQKNLSQTPKKEGAESEDVDEEEDTELNNLNPCLEKDSVVYAYSVAIERETKKRKRKKFFAEDLEVLFSSPAGKRLILEGEESKGLYFSEIESNFQSLNERLDKMKEQMVENFKILTDIQSSIC